MKKFLSIAVITLMCAGVFSSSAQAEDYCEYDALGTVLQFTPPYLVGPNGSVDGVTFGAQAGWWNDDLMGCYEAFKAPSLLPILPRCDQDGNGVVDIAWLTDMYYFLQLFGPSASAYYHVPCVGGCYDLGSVDFMAGTGAAQPLGAAVIDGACATITGNSVHPRIAPYVYADLAACEAACFGGSTGYECPAGMPAYYDPAAVHDETSIDWAANGICAEYHAELGDGVLACTQPEQDEFLADMNWIITNYPFTGAVFDSQKGGDQTYQYSPDKLLCSTGEGMFPDGFFDDIYECWHGDLDEGSSMVMTFDWNVNYYAAHDAYEAYVQETYPGGYCEIDFLIMGTPTGFHAEDQSGWKYWTVRSTESCDYYGCRCDASVSLWSDGTDYFVDQVTNDSTFNMYQGSKCEDPRFVF